MTAKLAEAPRTKVHVHCRLFKADIVELKRRSSGPGTPWQTLLRNLVHQALMRRGRIG